MPNEAYEEVFKFDPYSIENLLFAAHRLIEKRFSGKKVALFVSAMWVFMMAMELLSI